VVVGQHINFTVNIHSIVGLSGEMAKVGTAKKEKLMLFTTLLILSLSVTSFAKCLMSMFTPDSKVLIFARKVDK